MTDLFSPPEEKAPDEHEFERKLREMDERRALRKGETCGNCINGREWVTPFDEKKNIGGHRTGFIICSFAKQWQTRSPGLVCGFQPMRFKQAQKAVAAKSDRP